MIAADRDHQRSAVDDPERGGRSPRNFASVSTPGIATSPTSLIVTPEVVAIGLHVIPARRTPIITSASER